MENFKRAGKKSLGPTYPGLLCRMSTVTPLAFSDMPQWREKEKERRAREREREAGSSSANSENFATPSGLGFCITSTGTTAPTDQWGLLTLVGICIRELNGRMDRQTDAMPACLPACVFHAAMHTARV